MSETTDRAALIARARKYPGDLWDSEAIAEASRLLAGLTAELSNAEIELAVARAIVNESIRGDRVIRQKMDDAERELAAAKSVSANAVETLARIASLDISATKSIEDLVAPWRQLHTNA